MQRSEPRLKLFKMLKRKNISKRALCFLRTAISVCTLLYALNIIVNAKPVSAVNISCPTRTNYKKVTEYTDGMMFCEYEPILTTPETITIVTGSTSPTASLSIDGNNSSSVVTDSVNATYGSTAYSSHTVNVSVTEAASYSLILSGPTTLSGPSTVGAVSASGVKGSSMTNDTWGYAWENTNVANENATYKPLSSSVSLTGSTLSNKATSFSKKLSFAAKFQNAQAGKYHADITLSLVATPETTTTTVTAVPWDKMVYMQDMSNYACSSVSIGTSKTLKDIRDNSTYTIAKLSDGKCWMTQNLRLVRESLGADNHSEYIATITSLDSNIGSSYYTIPKANNGNFNIDSDNVQQIRSSANNDYGAYYSWCAATAGTCPSSGSAIYDICPKGWRLPSGGSSGEFQNLYSKYSTPTGFATDNGKNGYWIGGANIENGGAFFPAAGYVSSSGLGSDGNAGYYWSSTVNSSTTAYGLRLLGGINTNYYSSFPTGFSVRCIAK